MTRSFEQALAYHCAPALAGIKPACLICCDRHNYPDLDARLVSLKRTLSPKGLVFEPLRQTNSRVLLLVYRLPLLEQHLRDTQVRAFLKSAGYPEGGVAETVAHLKNRLRGEGFPHEAGVILGYPIADVEGFLRYGGKNCKLCGYWKVYDNETQARALFARFTRCRDALCALIEKGASIEQLFSSA